MKIFLLALAAVTRRSTLRLMRCAVLAPGNCGATSFNMSCNVRAGIGRLWWRLEFINPVLSYQGAGAPASCERRNNRHPPSLRTRPCQVPRCAS